MSQFTEFFESDEYTHWVVVDKIRVPDIDILAYRYENNPEMIKLFYGSDFHHLVEVSPVVFCFTGSKELTNLIKYDFALKTSTVVFSFKKNTKQEDRLNHLRSLLTVIINGDMRFFRYYSSVFLNSVHKGLNDQDKKNILGPFSSLTWVGEDDEWKSLVGDENKKYVNNGNTPLSLTSSVLLGYL
ncbi:DUF4123 domain-containing protein [Vibrio sp. ABG19]|uniref:DUF4123 domain-containing protein n=1 Tax=Vibrio sp. ABG19 TaxID=2817385 RepID=UPI00249E2AF8|nr:DUF4123 domain-containing protein [Vibrio sp. ABG19]WGY45798.1 DUF4123 domain-containing protein [Vibrio sp. ABG19]